VKDGLYTASPVPTLEFLWNQSLSYMSFNIMQTTMHQFGALVFSRVPEAYWLESLAIARCPMWCKVVDIALLWCILAINDMGVSILWITCEYPVDNYCVAQVVARGYYSGTH